MAIKTLENAKSFARPHKMGSKGIIEIDHYYYEVDTLARIQDKPEIETWLTQNNTDPFECKLLTNQMHIYRFYFKTYEAAFAFQLRWG